MSLEVVKGAIKITLETYFQDALHKNISYLYWRFYISSKIIVQITRGNKSNFKKTLFLFECVKAIKVIHVNPFGSNAAIPLPK